MKKITRALIGLFIILLIVFVIVCYRKYMETAHIVSTNIDSSNIQIKLSSKDVKECSIDGRKFVEVKNKVCTLEYEKVNDKIYLKNELGRVYKLDLKKESKVNSLAFSLSDIYLALDDTKMLNVSVDSIGKIDEAIKFTSSDETVATVDSNGLVKSVGLGSATITAELKGVKAEAYVLVTNLINKMDYEYNFSKKYLSCNEYSDSANDIIDAILKSRVDEAGRGTRAGVLAAAWFILLEFPRRINYFSENGRMAPYGVTNMIDGEGRYYHDGLYLSQSRTNDVKYNMYGPKPWGCQMYSYPSEGMRANGLDCSGFITWILKNGGFDPEDVGAGVSTIPDMTDLGKMTPLSTAVYQDGLIRSGDLLSGHGIDGGHIALVAGLEGDKIYVAESLWYGGQYLGALIKTYNKETVQEAFYWHVDMNEYYKEDGNFKTLWR